MSEISIEKLYANYEILTEAKAKIGEHTTEYEEIIAGVKGGEKEKKLASQFIAKFFKHFPTLQYQAIDALFDICEDDDMSIRKQAIKVLPNLCKDTKEHTLRVADILAQLLQLEDPQEHTIATNSLVEVIKIDPMQSVKGIMKQIVTGEYIVREKCIKLLCTKIQSLGSEFITKEIEDIIVSEIKKIVLDTTVEEYVSLMQYLAATKYGQTPAGQQEIIEIASEQAELNADFDPLDKESDNVDRLILCLNLILPYANAKHGKQDFTKFLEYICDKVLPQFEAVGTIERGERFQLEILRKLAELSTNCGQLTNSTKQVENVFNLLKTYIPLPPEDKEVAVFPLQDYSTVECLIYTFHRLTRQCPEFLTSNPDLLKDFRIRLQYFSRGVQGCIKTIKEGDIKNKKEDDKQKKNAYKITSNINTLIKDLFYTPPSYKSIVTLSWKSDEIPKKTSEPPAKNFPGKRHAPITIDFEKNAPAHKQMRKSSENVKIYTPPSGKFSNNFQNQNRKPMRGGRGRIGGRGRGRGRNNWRN